ncbi:PREDICTED: melanopsin-A-like [Cyprinodon variegatus]|uniref:melanopsin-A-like n=1 Tax=Cyprinodon variegatus TaxID=28743 RepID=UPI000742AB56|nr:PREDICTED: melanopsin-A-like [Cyprinodon variegatus]
MDSKLHIGPMVPTPEPTRSAPWNITSINPHRIIEASPVAPAGGIVPGHAFPTVNVPDHAHYTIGVVILAVGITGMLGNFLVIYAFSRSRSLRTPSNIFIINLAITDFLMCATQSPIFFITSMHKHWIFGKKGCELYAFCGALFGICSMMTLMVIAVDRYVVITRPLASLGAMSHKKALCFVAVAWVYSMGWSLPPFFGWSAYVPEGLMTSCSWDYMTFTPSVRSYTMLLFTFVFFIPLFIIIFCYCGIFRAIRHTTRAITKINCIGKRDSAKKFHKMRSEWKMAKIALIVILLFVISWAPYSCAALTAFAGYADMLTPYMNSVPAVIAKASAIHNPIIYAITHPKYRSAISRYVPYLGVLLCIPGRDRYSSSSLQSTRRSTLTSQSECKGTGGHHNSSQSESESAHFSDTEEDCSSRTPVSRHLSVDVKQFRHASQRSKTLTEPEDICMMEINRQPTSHLRASMDSMIREPGPKTVSKNTSSIIVTSISTPSILHSPPGYHGSLKVAKTVTPVSKELLDIAKLETTVLP